MLFFCSPFVVLCVCYTLVWLGALWSYKDNRTNHIGSFYKSTLVYMLKGQCSFRLCSQWVCLFLLSLKNRKQIWSWYVQSRCTVQLIFIFSLKSIQYVSIVLTSQYLYMVVHACLCAHVWSFRTNLPVHERFYYWLGKW